MDAQETSRRVSGAVRFHLLAHNRMAIPHQTLTRCREDYVTGQGSLAKLAAKHNLKLGTIEKCALREGWKDLRCEFEARQRDKLLPPLPTAPPAPIAPPTPQNELERQLHQLVAHRDRLDAMIAAETDPVKLDRLSSARSRVFEQWRILANVPLPGSRKPQKERRGPGSSLPPPTPVSAEQPSDPEPVPTP